MKSALLLSVLVATLAIPVLVARDPEPGRAVRRMLALLLAFNALYVAYVTMVHPVLFVPHW